MPKLYTIGYEGSDIDRFVATLKEAGVEVLADVRAVACSRKRGFSKSGLRNRLAEEGIAYVHFVELGDPKPGRLAARAGRHGEFLRIYRRHFSRCAAQQALLELRKVAQSQSTCLLCFERDSAACHRSIVADELAGTHLTVVNLCTEPSVRNGGHIASRPRRNHSEGATSA